MLLEAVGTVCHAASGLAIALFAATELVIHSAGKRRRLQRSVHAEFLNLAMREVFSGFRLQHLDWGQELGGCIGQMFTGHAHGLQVAVKAPKLGGPLGYDSNAAAIRREMKLAMRRLSLVVPLAMTAMLQQSEERRGLH